MVMIIRDSRTQKRFFIDNIIVDVYGPALPKGGLAVYMALCRYADMGTQSCYPSYQTITDKTKASRSQVGRILKAMKAMGLITWEHRAREDGSQTSNIYYLLNPPPSLPDTPPAQGDTPPGPGGDGARLREGHEQSSDEQSSDEGITIPSGSAAELVRMVFDLRDEYETHHNETFPEDAMRKYPEVTAGCLCGARVFQEMVGCPDCRNEVVWLNSRIWRDAFGDPNEASRDTSWQEASDDFTLRLFARLRIGRFRAKPQVKKWERVRKTATDTEILDAAKYVIGQREGGYGGLAHIMNLALKKASERPEQLTAEEAQPALEEREFPGATIYE